MINLYSYKSLHIFCVNWKKKSKRIYSGASSKTIEENFEAAVKQSSPDASIVLHCGTEDFHRIRARCTPKKELIARYKQIIKLFKENKSNRTLSISGILPRLYNQKGLNIGAVNRELEKICIDEDVGFIQTWDFFHKKRELYAKNGVHLSDIGKEKLGIVLSGSSINSFLSTHC